MEYLVGSDKSIPKEKILDEKSLDALTKMEQGIRYYDAVYSSQTGELDAIFKFLPSFKALVLVSDDQEYAVLELKMCKNIGCVVDGCMKGTYIENMSGVGLVPVMPDYNKY